MLGFQSCIFSYPWDDSSVSGGNQFCVLWKYVDQLMGWKFLYTAVSPWLYQFHCLEYPCLEGLSILFSPNTAWHHPLSKLSKKLAILVRSVWPLLEWIPSPLPHIDHSPDHLPFLASPIRWKDQDNDSVVSPVQGMGITASTHRFLPLPWSYCSRWLELQPPKGDIKPLKATSPLVQ